VPETLIPLAAAKGSPSPSMPRLSSIKSVTYAYVNSWAVLFRRDDAYVAYI